MLAVAAAVAEEAAFGAPAASDESDLVASALASPPDAIAPFRRAVKMEGSWYDGALRGGMVAVAGDAEVARELAAACVACGGSDEREAEAEGGTGKGDAGAEEGMAGDIGVAPS